MKRIITGLLTICLVFSLFAACAQTSEAKTYTKMSNGGYIVTYKSAKISDGKLVITGKVKNWERAYQTPSYNKSGTHKLTLAKKYTIEDGYKPSWSISKKKFNQLCSKKDSSHRTIVFVVNKNKVTLIRFW